MWENIFLILSYWKMKNNFCHSGISLFRIEIFSRKYCKILPFRVCIRNDKNVAKGSKRCTWFLKENKMNGSGNGGVFLGSDVPLADVVGYIFGCAPAYSWTRTINRVYQTRLFPLFIQIEYSDAIFSRVSFPFWRPVDTFKKMIDSSVAQNLSFS